MKFLKVHLWGLFVLIGYPTLVYFVSMLHDNYVVKIIMFDTAWLGSIFHYCTQISKLEI